MGRLLVFVEAAGMAGMAAGGEAAGMAAGIRFK